MATEFDPEQVTQQVAERLRQTFPDVPADEVERVAREEVDSLKDKPVSDYVAVLSERTAKKRLKQR